MDTLMIFTGKEAEQFVKNGIERGSEISCIFANEENEKIYFKGKISRLTSFIEDKRLPSIHVFVKLGGFKKM
jgi:hypothetical protein